MKKYRFKQLNKDAKIVAVIDYQQGYNEERTDDNCLTFDECYGACIDTNLETWYDKKGNMINE